MTEIEIEIPKKSYNTALKKMSEEERQQRTSEYRRKYKRMYLDTHKDICICPCSKNPFKLLNKQIHWGSLRHQSYIQENGADPEIEVIPVE